MQFGYVSIAFICFLSCVRLSSTCTCIMADNYHCHINNYDGFIVLMVRRWFFIVLYMSNIFPPHSYSINPFLYNYVFFKQLQVVATCFIKLSRENLKLIFIITLTVLLL